MMEPHQFRKDLARLLAEPPSSIRPFVPSLESYRALLNETEESSPLLRALLAAGMLTFGDLAAVGTILDYVPDVEPGTATGIMIAAPSLAFTIMLPLPISLRTTHRTVVDRNLFVEWFGKHQKSLVLDETTGRFTLQPTTDEV